MKDTTKRIYASTEEKADIKLFEHVEIMFRKGWIPTNLSGGQSGTGYENLVRLSKPKNEEEKAWLLNTSSEQGWQLNLNDACVIGWCWGEGRIT